MAPVLLKVQRDALVNIVAFLVPLKLLPHLFWIAQECPSRLETSRLVIFVVVCVTKVVSCLDELHQLIHVEVLCVMHNIDFGGIGKVLRGQEPLHLVVTLESTVTWTRVWELGRLVGSEF